jgi:hypothetical protein
MGVLAGVMGPAMKGVEAADVARRGGNAPLREIRSEGLTLVSLASTLTGRAGVLAFVAGAPENS